MKEAAGEANMTVITIVLIAVVLGVGTIVVNSLMTNMANKSCCTSLGGVPEGRTCRDAGLENPTMGSSFAKTHCPGSKTTTK